MRLARKLTIALVNLMSRIHAPLFWRAIYWLIVQDAFAGAAARTVEVVAARRSVTSRRVADDSLRSLVGWPHHRDTPWVNLSVKRAHWLVVRRLDRAAPPSRERSPVRHGAPVRVGVFGRFDTTTHFTRAFFAGAPSGTRLFLFDFESADPAPARSLDDIVERCVTFGSGELDELSAAIDEADLDLLLAEVRERPVDAIFDRIATPCVASLCAEVHLRHHPRIDFHLYCLQQADYLNRANRLYCAASRTRFSRQVVFPTTFPFDDHGLSGAARPPWRDREPLIVLHGRLLKASQPYLDTVFRIVAENSELTFVAIGQDRKGAVDRIRATARQFGVESRFDYRGPYARSRDGSGQLSDPAWATVFDHLRRARLAPDPWPLAGAFTRLEAFLCGAPVVHMGIRLDPHAWGKQQPMVTADHPALEIPAGTAYTVEQYAAACRRLLYDEAHADSVSTQQVEVAMRVTDRESFWLHLFDCHAQWQRDS